MSVIFKTLKKLRSQTAEEREKSKKQKKSRHIYSFRNMLLSPSSVLLFTLVIFLIGFGALYGVRHLRGYIKEKSLRSVVTGNIKTESQPRDITAEDAGPLTEDESPQLDQPQLNKIEQPESFDIPPPPDVIPEEEAAEPGRIYLPQGSSQKSIQKTPQEKTISSRYLPSKQSENQAVISGENEPPAETSPSLPAGKMSTITRRQPRKGLIAKKESQNEPGGYAPVPGAASMSKGFEAGESAAPLYPTPVEKKSLEEVRFLPRRTETVDSSRSAAPSFLPASRERSAFSPKEAIFEEPPEKSEAEKTDEKITIQQANVEKSSKIARLIAKIQKSMVITDNSHTTEELLDQLTVLKGEENNYILKLKAFLCISNNDYESASFLLKKVLDRNEIDFDAGINMAIVEIKTNRLLSARKRLTRLREIYPDNTLIPGLIQKLR